MKKIGEPQTCMECRKKLPEDGICRDRCIPKMKREYHKNEGVDRWRQ